MDVTSPVRASARGRAAHRAGTVIRIGRGSGREETDGGKKRGESSRVPVLLRRATPSLEGGICLNSPPFPALAAPAELDEGGNAIGDDALFSAPPAGPPATDEELEGNAMGEEGASAISEIDWRNERNDASTRRRARQRNLRSGLHNRELLRLKSPPPRRHAFLFSSREKEAHDVVFLQ